MRIRGTRSPVRRGRPRRTRTPRESRRTSDPGRRYPQPPPRFDRNAELRARVRPDRAGTVTTREGERPCALVLDFDGTITEVDLLQEVSRRFGDPVVVAAVEGALTEGRFTLQEEITHEFA